MMIISYPASFVFHRHGLCKGNTLTSTCGADYNVLAPANNYFIRHCF